MTGTITAKDGNMADKLVVLLTHLVGADFIAVEDFTHRPYLGRAIKTAPEMGRLIGYLEGKFSNIRKYPAEKTKANMEWVRNRFANEHEYSAYCVAVFAEGVLRQEGGMQEPTQKEEEE